MQRTQHLRVRRSVCGTAPPVCSRTVCSPAAPPRGWDAQVGVELLDALRDVRQAAGEVAGDDVPREGRGAGRVLPRERLCGAGRSTAVPRRAAAGRGDGRPHAERSRAPRADRRAGHRYPQLETHCTSWTSQLVEMKPTVRGEMSL